MGFGTKSVQRLENRHDSLRVFLNMGLVVYVIRLFFPHSLTLYSAPLSLSLLLLFCDPLRYCHD